jgi:hypothetical protein
MSAKYTSLARRLDKLEQQLAENSRRVKLRNCTCQTVTSAHTSAGFEAEMNQSCPAHGFRRLGHIIMLSFVNPDKSVTEDSAKLQELRHAYELRLSQEPHIDMGIKKFKK